MGKNPNETGSKNEVTIKVEKILKDGTKVVIYETKGGKK